MLRICVGAFVLLVLFCMFAPPLDGRSAERRAWRSTSASLDDRVKAVRRLVRAGSSRSQADAILSGNRRNPIPNSASPDSGTCKYEFTDGYVLLTFTNDTFANVEAHPLPVTGGARRQN